ncbi:MAG: hypothetical protein LAO30_13340 [Acidobacteriia bacterium]|nr:hypothetical protein [Terriglobia bacterium]
MSAKRLAVLVVPVLILVSSALAQVNDLSITAGRAFVSTQTIVNSGAPDPHIHFGNEETVAFNYGRLLKTVKIFGLSAELPVAIYPRMDVHSFEGNTPKDIGALFVTPSMRVNIFSGDSVSPWVSVGGGYGRFRESSTLGFDLPNPGPTGSNTGVVQFGAGLDVWVWHRWGARFEARDFYSGVPALNVDTGKSRQHNYYVGVGVVHRF